MNLQNYSAEKDSSTDLGIFALFIVLFITRQYHLMLPADGDIDWIAIQRKPRRCDEMSWLKIITGKEKIQDNLTFATVSHRWMVSAGVVLQ